MKRRTLLSGSIAVLLAPRISKAIILAPYPRARREDSLLTGCALWGKVFSDFQGNSSKLYSLMGPVHGTPTNFPVTSTASRGFAGTTRRGGHGEFRSSATNLEGHIQYPVDAFAYTGVLTILLWVQIRSAPSSNDRLLQHDLAAGSGGAYQLRTNATNQVLYLWSGATRLTFASTLTTGKWHHLAFVRSGSTGSWVASGYLDGKLDATSGTVTTNPATTAGHIMTVGATTDGTASGAISFDSWMIYPKVLTHRQINEIMLDDLRGNPRLLDFRDSNNFLGGVGNAISRGHSY